MFDVSNEEVDMILKEFEEIKEDNTTLEKLTSLPPLQETDSGFDGNRFDNGRDRRDRFSSRRSRFDDRDDFQDNRNSFSSRPYKRSLSYNNVKNENDFDSRSNNRYSQSKPRRSSSYHSLDDGDEDFDMESNDRRRHSSSKRSSRSFNNVDADDDDIDGARGFDKGQFRPRKKY